MWTSVVAGLGFGLALIVAIGAQNAYVLRQGLRRERVALVVAICALSDLVLIAVGAAGVGTVVATSRTLTVVMTVLGAGVLLTYGALAARRAVRGGDALVVEAPVRPATADPATADLARADLAPAGLATADLPTADLVSADLTTAGLTTAGPAAADPAPAPLLAERNTGHGPAVAPGGGVPVGGGRAGRTSVALTALALTWLNPHVYLDTVVLLGSVAAGHGDARWWFAAGAGLGSVLWFSALGFGAALLRPVFARPGAWRVLDAVVALVMVGIAASLVLDLLV